MSDHPCPGSDLPPAIDLHVEGVCRWCGRAVPINPDTGSLTSHTGDTP